MNRDDRGSARRLSGVARHISSALDISATLLIGIAAAVAIVFMLRTWPSSRSASLPTVEARQEDAGSGIPKAPQPLDGAVLLGNQHAKVAIIEYADFQCPYCATFVRDTWPELRKQYVQTGKVLMAFRHLPLPMHPFAKAAALSADCAREQGRFWPMHDLLFARSKNLTEATGVELAASLHLDMGAFKGCVERISSPSVSRDQETATAIQLAATPTFLIGRIQPDRTVRVLQVVPGAHRFDHFKSALDSLLQ